MINVSIPSISGEPIARITYNTTVPIGGTVTFNVTNMSTDVYFVISDSGGKGLMNASAPNADFMENFMSIRLNYGGSASRSIQFVIPELTSTFSGTLTGIPTSNGEAYFSVYSYENYFPVRLARGTFVIGSPTIDPKVISKKIISSFSTSAVGTNTNVSKIFSWYDYSVAYDAITNKYHVLTKGTETVANIARIASILNHMTKS